MTRCISHQRFLPSLARFPSTVLQHLPAGYSAAVLLSPLLCRVQPIAAQSMLSRHWLFNELLRHTVCLPSSLSPFFGHFQPTYYLKDLTNLREPPSLSQQTIFMRRHLTPTLRSCRLVAPKELEGSERGPHQRLDEGKERRFDTLKAEAKSRRKNDVGHGTSDR